jgi:general secretion pathway protein D
VPEAPAAAAGPRLIFTPPTGPAQVGSPINVQLMVENVADLFSAPVRIQFDPKVLRLTSIKPGTLMSGDGSKINFSENTLNDTGEATITLNRAPGSPSVSGSGVLLNFVFQAVGRGLKNPQLAPIAVQNPAVTITVQ